MELLLGSPVFADGRKTGRLAGFEVEPTNLRVLRIIYSSDARMGSHALSRPIDVVSTEGRRITITERPSSVAASAVEGLVWSRTAGIRVGGRARGHLCGVDVTADGQLEQVLAKRHW